MTSTSTPSSRGNPHPRERCRTRREEAAATQSGVTAAVEEVRAVDDARSRGASRRALTPAPAFRHLAGGALRHRPRRVADRRAAHRHEPVGAARLHCRARGCDVDRFRDRARLGAPDDARARGVPLPRPAATRPGDRDRGCAHRVGDRPPAQRHTRTLPGFDRFDRARARTRARILHRRRAHPADRRLAGLRARRARPAHLRHGLLVVPELLPARRSLAHVGISARGSRISSTCCSFPSGI